jgi:hypothetical protein
MSWKKHFTTYNGQQSPISGDRSVRDNGKDNTSRFQSWLPEVYVGMPNRLERYIQYDQMDMDSEINTALDTIAEFSTQKDDTTEVPFNIEWGEEPTESESEIVQTVLRQWCKVNEWNRRMFKTFRNTIKYGDQPFIRDPETWKLYYVNPADVVKVIVDEANGKDPSQYVIKNIDPNFQNLTATTTNGTNNFAGASTLSPTAMNTSVNARTPSMTTNGSGINADMEYLIDASHVIHLALTDGMDLAWPFGNSILDPVFKTYKQKELLEDSIIIYRVQRAPERRIFYIDTGDMPPHQAMAHVERIKNEIHQRRIPSRTGGGASMMDAQYNPLSIMEDYFFAQTADGRGSKVDTLPGGQGLGDIDDLKFFTNKMARALRVPASYLPTGPDDGTGAAINDGKVGTAFIEEFRFTQYCERLQNMIQNVMDKEFKMFLKNRGYEIDSSQFELGFREPQSFSDYREIEIDGARASVFGQVEGIDYMSKRFALKKYLGWTDDEILENEKMWKQENPDKNPEGTMDDDEFSDLGNVGVRGGADGSLDDFEDGDFGDEEDFDAEAGGDEESPIAGDEGEQQ